MKFKNARCEREINRYNIIKWDRLKKGKINIKICKYLKRIKQISNLNISITLNLRSVFKKQHILR